MSVRVTVTSNGNLRARAEAAARRTTEIVMGELEGAFQQSFTAKAWEWLRETVRSNGSKVGSPRNLIDTGNLRQSGYFRMVGPYRGLFGWSANYATARHEGAWIYPWGNRDAERVYLPPCPWTRAVLGQENVAGIRPFPVGDRLKNVWLVQLQRSRGS